MTTNPFAPAALLSGEPGTILGHRIKHYIEPSEHIEVANFIHAMRDLGSLPRPSVSEDHVRGNLRIF